MDVLLFHCFKILSWKIFAFSFSFFSKENKHFLHNLCEIVLKRMSLALLRIDMTGIKFLVCILMRRKHLVFLFFKF